LEKTSKKLTKNKDGQNKQAKRFEKKQMEKDHSLPKYKRAKVSGKV